MADEGEEAVARLLAEQDDVVARRQLKDAGVSEPAIRRLLRRSLSVAHPGVYVGHSGPLLWRQRAWVAVLHAWPASLWGESALLAGEGGARLGGFETGPIDVMVAHGRTLRMPAGVRLHRRLHAESMTMWNTSPPRQRYADAIIDLAAAERTALGTVGVLARGIQRQRTTAERLGEVVAHRGRCADRAWIAGVLDDLAAGACSVLEHGYLDRVERPHALPESRRQVRAVGSRGVVYRDAENAYVVVELDGRAFHDDAASWETDMERDLDAAAEGQETLRLSYGQVFDHGCSTAMKLGRVMRRRGWPGRAKRCGAGCAVTDDLEAA